MAIAVTVPGRATETDLKDQTVADVDADGVGTDHKRHGLHESASLNAIAATAKIKTDAAISFAKQAEHLSLLPHNNNKDDEKIKQTTAVQARFITPRDPVIETASGERLPAVPLTEAWKLNQLKSQVADIDIEHAVQADGETETKPREGATSSLVGSSTRTSEEKKNEAKSARFQAEENGEATGDIQPVQNGNGTGKSLNRAFTNLGRGRTSGPLDVSAPPSHTNPLFPPLPLYGPPSLLRSLQCGLFRFTSFFLSLAFLMVIVLGSAFTSIPLMFRHIGIRLTLGDPDARRPFYEREKERAAARAKADLEWNRKRRRRASFGNSHERDTEDSGRNEEEFVLTEGGKDPLQCDVAYYARRVGLDIEEFKVHTEDGFVITLWHVFNPREYMPASKEERQKRRPEVFSESTAYNPDDSPCSRRRRPGAPRRYPVLLIHGLLQSSGAYCSNDDESLAFFLAKSGFDVWLGNNRCGFQPEHTLLEYGDPRLWCFNIRQMGVMDLPALISRVLGETGFPKLGLVCHSQGTTQTFVALAKEQRPDLGQRISVFCALAPAVYAGPLIGKMYFKFMKVISPAMFRVFFGIHAFIPFMMTMHSCMPGRLYGAMGYRVFSFLFGWTDERWDRGLRNRMFRFSPVYVSAESMRWWLGRECFAKHKCILATREDSRREDAEDAAEDASGDATEKAFQNSDAPAIAHPTQPPADAAVADVVTEDLVAEDSDSDDEDDGDNKDDGTLGAVGRGAPAAGSAAAEEAGRRAWYDGNAPPMAFWIAGNDQLVDGRRLLRRFARGREPHVRVVHAKVIPEYEHLDVLWALDVIEQVGEELRSVLWKSALDVPGVVGVEGGPGCAVPRGCGNIK